MRRGVIIHHPSDTVGVAIVDLEPGEQLRALLREGGTAVAVTPTDPIPLGHKVALADVGQGEQVVEYGLPIGRAVRAIAAGEHVHTHNLEGERWA